MSESQESSCDYIDCLISFIYDFLDKQLQDYRQIGFMHCLSGGIDSALFLKMVVERYGPEYIRCLITKVAGFTNQKDVQDAVELCEENNVIYKVVDLTNQVRQMRKLSPELEMQPIDNIASRIRIGLACELATFYNLRLVYAGPYSDWAITEGDPVGAAVAHCFPFAALYKYEIYEIAKRMNMNDSIIKKKPSNSSVQKTNTKDIIHYGLKKSDIEKLVMFFNGLISEDKIKHIQREKRIYFEYRFNLFKKDIDYPATDIKKPEEFGRKEFFQKFDSLPFEK